MKTVSVTAPFFRIKNAVVAAIRMHGLHAPLVKTSGMSVIDVDGETMSEESLGKSYLMDTAKECLERDYPFMLVAFQVMPEGNDDMIPLHIAAYPAEPQVADVKSLVEELKTDNDLGMTEYGYKTDYYLMAFKAESVIEALS